MHPLLKLEILCHYSIKIIFFGYSKNAISRNCGKWMADLRNVRFDHPLLFYVCVRVRLPVLAQAFSICIIQHPSIKVLLVLRAALRSSFNQNLTGLSHLNFFDIFIKYFKNCQSYFFSILN